MAGGDVELPQELAKMIEEDTEEEEERASVLGQLASLPGLDLGSLKDRPEHTGDLKQSAEGAPSCDYFPWGDQTAGPHKALRTCLSFQGSYPILALSPCPGQPQDLLIQGSSLPSALALSWSKVPIPHPTPQDPTSLLSLGRPPRM